MRISAKGEYAIQAVLDLSLHRERGLTAIQEIARRQAIPQRYLEQVLLALKRAGLLTSKRGSAGGYQLTRPPEDITVDFLRVEGNEQQRVRGPRVARRVAVVPRLLGDDPEKDPFSLLELTGDLAIYIDAETALPLRVQGSWLRVGSVPAELARAELEPGCTR